MVARFFSGAFASTGSSLVGGTISDIWEPHEYVFAVLIALHSPYAICYRRGLPMAVFSVINMVTNGLGSIISGWLELDPHLQWRWIQWIQGMSVHLMNHDTLE